MKRLALLALLLLAGCGGGRGTVASHPRHTDLATCGDSSACYARALGEIVDGARDPSAAVDGIVSAAYAQQGYLLANCHGLMHTVGREYVARHHISIAKLMDYLPRSNDPACAAGYAHGLVTGIAPQIEAAGGAKAAVICKQSTTRMQRYSCVHGFGHAFMRLNGDKLQPALELCAQLGAGSAPDCAQGAFHDYWFAAKGLDDAPSQPAVPPRELCASVAAQFVRPCWYRAFIEAAKPVRPVASPADIDALCSGLDGLQRQGCVTGAVMTGPPDPRAELAICTGVRPGDALSCIRGTKVTNMLGYDPRIYPILIGDCEHFPGTLSLQCDRWLGKAIGVITDGKFASSGCPLLQSPAARQQCTAGVKSMNGALVTFS